MSTNKRIENLSDYTSVLPFDSEVFGIYQPLIGWKSKRMTARFNQGHAVDRSKMLDRLVKQFPAGRIWVQYPAPVGIANPATQMLVRIQPALAKSISAIRNYGSKLMSDLAATLPASGDITESQWLSLVNETSIQSLLNDVANSYEAFYLSKPREGNTQAFRDAFEAQLRHESSVAGSLLFLVEQKKFSELSRLFSLNKNKLAEVTQRASILGQIDLSDYFPSISTLNPRDQDHIRAVALSPISVVHLFRQYFFELDTFLGTPVSHVWLSPGSTVELIEIHTRKSIVEKAFESETETTLKRESESTTQDEISDAVKDENKQDIKFGASVTASYASVTATSSFDFNNTQQTAREETHKRMRQQTERLSTEIRKNYKTTFRTVTETTDTSSKRYVLSNSTSDLVNYELRRKMRQVAVQVQDIGSYLCWQTYVDRPGESLGVSSLIHIGKPADLDGLHAPAEIPMLTPFPEEKVVTLPFQSDDGADREGEVYINGREMDNGELFGQTEHITCDFKIDCICPKGNYVLTDVEFDSRGLPVVASRRGDISNLNDKASFWLHLDSVDFRGQDSVQVKLNLIWSPAQGANDDIIKKNKENLESFSAKEALEYQKAYVENAKERIKLTHKIKARPSDELREEERIVIYRKLIQDMLMSGVTMPDDRTRHIVAELIASIFDVDKMLYFVAPEWWRPRVRSKQQWAYSETDGFEGLPKDVQRDLGGPLAQTHTLAACSVGWGGVGDSRRDNYFITDDSEPAKFGSSLGWLLQLDGDNMRNAFLNAPWVKAVIPIRPGKEEAAINWLQGVEGFNGISETDLYQAADASEKDINGNSLDGQKVIDVILDLAKKIQRKHKEALKSKKYPTQDEVAAPVLVDAENSVTATPVDRVYEHGFFPLQGGFRANVQGDFEIFDQWLEILPTDQIVPVEVKYDPKTGRQI